MAEPAEREQVDAEVARVLDDCDALAAQNDAALARAWALVRGEEQE